MSALSTSTVEKGLQGEPDSPFAANSTASEPTPSVASVRRHRIVRAFSIVVKPITVFVPVFLIGTFITFLLRHLSGLSPAYLQAGDNATPELIAQIESQWGLDEPFIVQYVTWLGNLLQGELGTSWYNGISVTEQLYDRAIITVSIALLALFLGLLFGTLLGVLAAKYQQSLLDRGITTVTTVVSAMPPFVVGILLISIFAINLGWFPAAGYMPLENGTGIWLWFAILPAIALSVDVVSDIARQLRAGLVGIYQQNYILGARLRGYSSSRVFWVHGFRNGIGPTVALLGLKFPAVLGGAVVTEMVFGISGYGRFAADSAMRGDVPAVQGVLVVSIVLVVVFNVLVNIILNKLAPAGQRGV
ncbi:MAG: ABC transporter permease [Micrococcaceae bacterium]